MQPLISSPKRTGVAPDYVLDSVADLGAGLLEWGDPDVAAAVETVQGRGVVVFASPTYKATYTGLMKLFLDQIPQDGLAGVTRIAYNARCQSVASTCARPLFKPVLVELGATCPTVGLRTSLTLPFAEDPQLDAWVAHARGTAGMYRLTSFAKRVSVVHDLLVHYIAAQCIRSLSASL